MASKIIVTSYKWRYLDRRQRESKSICILTDMIVEKETDSNRDGRRDGRHIQFQKNERTNECYRAGVNPRHIGRLLCCMAAS